MSIRGIFFDNQSVSAANHAVLFAQVMPDGVINGAEITFDYATVYINAGMIVMAGRIWEIQGSEAVNVSSAGGYAYARIKAQIDLTQPSTGADNFQQVNFVVEYASDLDGFADLITDAINTGNGTIYETEAAVVSVDTESGITALVRRWS